MRKALSVLLFAPALFFFPGIAASATLSGSILHDGLTRTFVYYVPDNLPDGPVPLLFCLHGGGGTGMSTIMVTLGRFNQLAERDKFIAVYPDGVSNQWNDCRSDASIITGEADDTGFIAATIDWFSAGFSIDARRVYACGISNGAMMSYRLAFELSDRIAAVAAVVGNLPANSECSGPTNPIPVLIMDGTVDPLMPYDGGFVAGQAFRGLVLSVDSTVSFWVSFTRSASVPVIEDLPDTNATDDSTVTRFSYSGGARDSEVILCRVNGGGHTWPGGLQYQPVMAIGPTNRDINACDEIWDFFRRHQSPAPTSSARSWVGYR